MLIWKQSQGVKEWQTRFSPLAPPLALKTWPISATGAVNVQAEPWCQVSKRPLRRRRVWTQVWWKPHPNMAQGTGQLCDSERGASPNSNPGTSQRAEGRSSSQQQRPSPRTPSKQTAHAHHKALSGHRLCRQSSQQSDTFLITPLNDIISELSLTM